MPTREACSTPRLTAVLELGDLRALLPPRLPSSLLIGSVEETNWTQLRALGDTSFGTAFGGKDKSHRKKCCGFDGSFLSFLIVAAVSCPTNSGPKISNGMEKWNGLQV